MSEQFTSEALCKNCPMRNFAGSDGTFIVNWSRCNPEVRSDRRMVERSPIWPLLLDALKLSRPARCKAIRGVLPKVGEPTAHRVSATACAEMQLVDVIYCGHILDQEGDDTGTLDT